MTTLRKKDSITCMRYQVRKRGSALPSNWRKTCFQKIFSSEWRLLIPPTPSISSKLNFPTSNYKAKMPSHTTSTWKTWKKSQTIKFRTYSSSSRLNKPIDLISSHSNSTTIAICLIMWATFQPNIVLLFISPIIPTPIP